MKITPKSNIRRFQEGGVVSPEGAPVEEPGMEEGAPMEAAPALGGNDPIMELAQIFAQGLQNQDCNMLAQGAQMFLQLIQGGGQAAPEGQPVFRKGGRLVAKVRK